MAHEHHVATTKIAGFIGLGAGVIAALISFITKSPNTSVILGAIAAGIGIVCLWMSRKNIDDMQLATAGLFMAVVSLVIGLWMIYS
ncbi:hypothetical protein F0L74_02645 [Chitinophaga agrisoli]|uniref:Uncharacterized protein n=1 Tax=Chitinophaga agrisoli TaxID=2607653 RepID=A0A5B2W2A8_9BACT|nr:hypothetical protein [Chitinophaga agrisoli]KAA2244880.1 hypothetical protein F0L74_02645 [Chitinophaga agrisoli]